jgi:hypothetical protein
MHSKELHDLYLSLRIIHVKKILEDRMGGVREMNGGKENCILDFGRET